MSANSDTGRRRVLERVASMPETYFARVEAFIAGLAWSREELRALNKHPAKPKTKAMRPQRASPALRLVVDYDAGVLRP